MPGRPGLPGQPGFPGGPGENGRTLDFDLVTSFWVVQVGVLGGPSDQRYQSIINYRLRFTGQRRHVLPVSAKECRGFRAEKGICEGAGAWVRFYMLGCGVGL